MFDLLKNKWEELDEKRRQLFRAIAVIAVIVILSCVFSYVRNSNNKLYDKKQTKIDFSDVKGKGKIEDAWLERSENKLDDLENQIATEKRDKEELQKKLDDLINNVQETSKNNQQQIQSQIDQLRKENSDKANQNNKPPIKQNGQSGDIFGRGGNPNEDASVDGNGEFDQPLSSTRQIDLINFSVVGDKNSFALDNYLPAGAYVKAVLISAVDASVGVSSQSDPRPVLFRLVSEARSAVDKDKTTNEDKQLTTNIKGCTVTGAAHADLSSERAYARLLKMTCPDGKGGVIETDVEGYAADGSDGKAGIVGKKITREGDLLAKSFFAGMVGGFGQGLSAKVAPPLAFSNGLTTQGTLSTDDVVKQGLGKGISTSGDRLSNYLIDRAEQYQPVISVSSGKEVELVFISGTYLDGRKSIPKTELKNNNQH